MDFVINDDELGAICGLSHIQQLSYFRGIRPYMDVKTGLAGIKRRISYQSIAEQLYVEPHQGIKVQRLSRDQVRRAVSGLVRSGAITVQSEGLHLILKCELATRAYSVQNKAATNPPQKAAINIDDKSLLDTECLGVESWKGDTAETSKAATPLKEESYIYLLSQFEKFWSCYPEKKSRNNALQAFQAINPEPSLFNQIMQALEAQIQHRETKQARGLWVPPWKFPANWLTQYCWEDEINLNLTQEISHANHQRSHNAKQSVDPFWDSCKDGIDDSPETNVIDFSQHRKT